MTETDLNGDQHDERNDDAQQERLLPVANTEVQNFGEEASCVCWLHAYTALQLLAGSQAAL